MRVAVIADMHAHADALEAVLAAADGVDELWSLGDMVGTGPDPAEVVARVRAVCRVALLRNHTNFPPPAGRGPVRGNPDYLALRDGDANPSIEYARAVLDEDALTWMRSRKPAANV